MVPREIISYFYSAAKYNGTRVFYDWLRKNLCAEMRVLNVGAGPATGNPIRVVKGEVSSIVGADIDPVVLDNKELDQAVVIENDRLPFPVNHFDLAYSDYVLEHVEHPQFFLSEIHRVLKPGASFFFRTPNRTHYVALGSRLTPHWVHKLVANRMRGLPGDAHDPWPSFYRLNGKRQIERHAAAVGFRTAELRMIETEPSYLVFNTLTFLLGVVYERLVNSTEILGFLRANIFGRLTK